MPNLEYVHWIHFALLEFIGAHTQLVLPSRSTDQIHIFACLNRRFYFVAFIMRLFCLLLFSDISRLDIKREAISTWIIIVYLQNRPEDTMYEYKKGENVSKCLLRQLLLKKSTHYEGRVNRRSGKTTNRFRISIVTYEIHVLRMYVFFSGNEFLFQNKSFLGVQPPFAAIRDVCTWQK